MLGAFAIFHGPENPDAARISRPKINDLQLAYSRDGFHWHRPHREAFIGASRRNGATGTTATSTPPAASAWSSATNSGSTTRPSPARDPCSKSARPTAPTSRATPCTPAATPAWPRCAATASPRCKPTAAAACWPPGWSRSAARNLFVNLDAPRGELRAEILDERGDVIQPFSLANCRPLAVDATRYARDLERCPGSVGAGRTPGAVPLPPARRTSLRVLGQRLPLGRQPRLPRSRRPRTPWTHGCLTDSGLASLHIESPPAIR